MFKESYGDWRPKRRPPIPEPYKIIYDPRNPTIVFPHPGDPQFGNLTKKQQNRVRRELERKERNDKHAEEMKAKAKARAERKATNLIDWKKRFKKTATGKHFNGPEITPCNPYDGGFSNKRVAIRPMDFNRRTKAPPRLMKVTRKAPSPRPRLVNPSNPTYPPPNMRTLAYPPPNMRTIAHPPPPMRMAAPPNLRMPYYPSRMAPPSNLRVQYDFQPIGLSKTAFVQQNGKMAKKKKTGKCYVQ